MDVTTLSIEALKSLAYDQIMAIEQAQQNLAVLRQELAKRGTPEE